MWAVVYLASPVKVSAFHLGQYNPRPLSIRKTTTTTTIKYLPDQWLQPGAVVGCEHIGAGRNPKALSGGQERCGAAS